MNDLERDELLLKLDKKLQAIVTDDVAKSILDSNDGVLLVRIDERVKELKEKDIPEIKGHLTEVTGTLLKHSNRLTRAETIIKYIFYGGGGISGGAVIAKIMGLY